MQQVLTHSCPPRRPPALPLAETDGRLRELGHQLLERHGPAGTQDESDGITGRAPAARIVLGRFAEREGAAVGRSEEHTSELQPLMRISYAVFNLKKQTTPKYYYTIIKTMT